MLCSPPPKLGGGGGGGVKTLRITDGNTTGADDNCINGGRPSKWASLTKSTGLSVKDQRDAAGSFGLGKHAPFAVTDLRTVLYSTAWRDGCGQLRRRFQGKTILVSHEKDGHKFRKTGYLGGACYTPLVDDDVPTDFRLNEPGLSLHIPGYEPESSWKNDSVKAVITHFFHAIIHNGLAAEVDGRVVDSATLDQCESLFDPNTADFIKASRTEPVAETDIPDIGRVTLRLVVGDSADSRKRQIALVRDAGMLITDSRRDMSIPGILRIPGHWRGFTAIIECLSQGQPSVLRESESPSHDRISTDQILDSNRRKRAGKALKELGDWCCERIKEKAAPPPSDSQENAMVMARYLPIDDAEGDPGSQQGNSPELAVTAPEQRRRAPPAAGNYNRRGQRRESESSGGNSDTETSVEPGKGGKRKSRRRVQERQVPAAFGELRFLPGKRRPTHSLVASFSAPENTTLRNIQLMASVEDGKDEPVGIREAYAGNRKLAVKHNKITSLPISKSGRISIEFIAQVPVSDKTYYLPAETRDEIQTQAQLPASGAAPTIQ